ncbi:AraC family transcriptional regulator [Nocardiopsis sediminis]|uniref:AraC family transcriptional regulator n=1 Tax=Nocardiopsis sediminis TaxID=1778267 RepID=A0ABV8FL56_9ACTN
MIEETFTSEEFPRAERFARFHDWMGGSYSPMRVTTDHTDDFRFRQRNLTLGRALVWPTALHATAFSRTPRLIRAGDPGDYHLGLIVDGTVTTDWGRHQTSYVPGQIFALDLSRPFGLAATNAESLFSAIGIKLPRESVGLPDRLVAKVIDRPMSYREGMGSALAGFISRLTSTAHGLTPGDGRNLATVLGDLVSALFAHTLEADEALAPEPSRRSLVLRIQAFIRQNLHDPGLDPAMIAAAHHISTRHLHQLFREEGKSTVMASIRSQRLEGARRDLADPRQSGTPVRHIATRWGFSHHAVFTRAFRDFHGIAPSDARSASTARDTDPPSARSVR